MESSKPSVTLPLAASQGNYRAGKKRVGVGYNATKLAILRKLLQCSLSKHTSHCCKPLMDFQVSEKDDVDYFCFHIEIKDTKW